jgi:hypothetical protein
VLNHTLLIVLLMSACAGPGTQPPEPPHNEPLSTDEHLAEAQRHDRVADEQSRIKRNSEGAPIECFDTPVPGLEIGGEDARPMQPCWTSVESPTEKDQRIAQWHRKASRDHRERASSLVSVEKQSCGGLGEDSIAMDPFHQRRDLVSVKDVGGKNTPKGVEISLKKVTGLSAEWLLRVCQCHQARGAAVGFTSTFMPTSPLTVGPSQVSAKESQDAFSITITTAKEAFGDEIRRRAHKLEADAPDKL